MFGLGNKPFRIDDEILWQRAGGISGYCFENTVKIAHSRKTAFLANGSYCSVAVIMKQYDCVFNFDNI